MRGCFRRSERITLAAWLVVGAVWLAGPPVSAQVAPLYKLTALDGLGGTESGANAINASGQVVGYAMTLGGSRHAVRWDVGSTRATDLGTLGGTESGASDINASGQVVGVATTTRGAYHAVRWGVGSTRATDLGTLGGTNSFADGINDSGQVAGTADTLLETSYGYPTHAVRWASDGTPTDLGTQRFLPWDRNSSGLGINASGQVVGVAKTLDGHLMIFQDHAYRWASDGTPTPLGAIADPTWALDCPYAINASGQAVGDALVGRQTHAIRWASDGTPTDLGLLWLYSSSASDINASGQVVGWLDPPRSPLQAVRWASDGTPTGLSSLGGGGTHASGSIHPGSHACLWSGGSIFDLNACLGDGAGLTLVSAQGINDSGQIVGSGTDPNGQWRAFLLTPIRRPTAPTSVTVAPGPRALVGQNLTAAATGATDPEGDNFFYIYQWAKSTDGGTTWGAWGWQVSSDKWSMISRSLTSPGDRWKARAAARDRYGTGPWRESAVVTVNSPATAPSSVVISPSPGARDDANLVATASGSTDAEGDSLAYVYQWCMSSDGGVTWGAWGWTTKSTTTATLDKSQTHSGELWKVRSGANDGYQTGAATESAVVALGVPTAPTSVTVTPGPRALDDQNLTAAASGATDPNGNNLFYIHQWAESTDGGTTWSAWGWQATTTKTSAIGRSLTTPGDRWKARAAASDGHRTGAWLESAVVTVNTPATAPSSVVISPSPQAGDGDNLVATASGSTDAEGDSLRYVYRWCKSTDGGVTWGAWGGPVWGTPTATLAKALTSPGEQWKVLSGANDGYQTGAATESAAVEITSATTVASAPLVVTATAAPTRDQNVAITVNLSAATEVGASVLNLAGREVSVIPPSRLVAGINTVWWNGRSVSGTRVPGGRYLVRLQARHGDGGQSQALVPLMLRR
jgi:probable HAF family extracellular repeat protein